MVMAEVAPFGERRADKRAAWVGANMAAILSPKSMQAEELKTLVELFQAYLASQTNQEEAVDMRALEKVKGGGGHA